MVALPRIIVKRWPEAGIDVSFPAECSLGPFPSSVPAGPCNLCESMPAAAALHRSNATWPRSAVPSFPGSRSARACFCMHTACCTAKHALQRLDPTRFVRCHTPCLTLTELLSVVSAGGLPREHQCCTCWHVLHALPSCCWAAP